MTELGAIVLAGGTGERLGGQLKSELVLGGERFLDISLSHLASADIRPVVVVAPTYVGVPGGIHHTMEDPPGGGPVAGVAAGLALLCESYPELEMVAVLTCDAPFAALAVAPLVAALPPQADGVAAISGEVTEYLLAVYRVSALLRRMGDMPTRDTSARRFFGGLVVERVEVPELALADVDTWEDLARLEVRGHDAGAASSHNMEPEDPLK